MNFRNSILVLLIGSLALIGCKKDFDSPPVAVLPEGNIITIDSLRKIYTAFDTTITADLSVYGTVTADEVSGNLYKVLYIQDGTNAIQLELTASSSNLYFEGDEVRVALKGTTVARENNMLKVINVDPEKNIIKQGEGEKISPKVVKITDLAISGVYSPYQGQLIQLNDVEFICDDIWSTYADPIAQYDQNRTLRDTLGNTIIVRSSGYSSFAGTTLAKGKGSFVAIVSQYNTTVQLTIRKLDDLSLYGTRKVKCPIYVKNFEDQNITSGGWTKQNVVGNINWAIDDIGSNGTFYAMISNYSGTNTACETWLVSPDFDLTNLTNPILYFQSAYKYTGDPLKLYVTTAYTGDVTTTTWTDITSSATWSSGNFAWMGSGNISLTSYKQAGVRFAFKYTGTNSNGSTWEIDDFTINDL